jgi:hypothetical protein
LTFWSAFTPGNVLVMLRISRMVSVIGMPSCWSGRR